MRCFIAIDIDEEIRAALGDLQQKLRGSIDVKKGDINWVNPDNIHLTLKFLGEIKDEKVAEICNIVEAAAGRHKDFELDIESVGNFGGRSPKVLWVGTGKGGDDLLKLQEDIEESLALAGWPEETREFAGHLTLCRIRHPIAGMKLAQASVDYKDFKLGTLSADSVSVYQSELKPSGPVYTVLGNYKLQ
ncbi:MAG: RNA 2',3'-cyclic phosphodiesterase [Phycisphaerae bacterium]|nr:RNA 2',3'-cyclic phosphodiesterase [Phycisphaerae bacterium]MDD5380407.1 RNA 2',3'-cyclic phosphodiesterase [Phycisphaerae bacterium]